MEKRCGRGDPVAEPFEDVFGPEADNVSIKRSA